MIYRFGKDQVVNQLVHQLKSLYLIDEEYVNNTLLQYFDNVMERVEKCFSSNPNKYYSRIIDGKKEIYFDSLHSCQWFIFLYFFANTIYRNTDKTQDEIILCDEIYALSKMLSGADLYYAVEMPDVFMCDHPVGTVIGRATYKDGFSFMQGNTVGNNHGVYPQIGKNVVMMSNSKILGNSVIGDNVIIAANTYVKDQNVPDNSMVFGCSPNLIVKMNPNVK